MDIRHVARRTFVGGMVATASTLVKARASSATVRLVAGGYAREGSPGILPIRYDPAHEKWTPGQAESAGIDASWMVASRDRRLLYAVREGREGMVSVFRTAEDGLAMAASASTGGADPCHLALNRTEGFLAAANYSSGSIALFRLDAATGAPAGSAQVRVHHGSGPRPDRQSEPHAHWVGFSRDDRCLFAVDLGADAIFAYPFDPNTGALGDVQVAYKGVPGAGPRHLAFHPSGTLAFLVNELANTVTALRVAPSYRFAAVGSHSTVPAGFAGPNAAAEIALNAEGTRLYVSNRGHDSVAVFAVDPAGALTLLQHAPSGGRWPRHILLLGRERRLLVANEHSGNLASFRIDPDGRLAFASARAVPGVTFVGRLA